MTGGAERELVAARALSPAELRQRSVDGRGVADIRLLQMEDGPGRGQRLLVVRNASGIGFEIALDRGFDISSATWRGINIGWNSANGLPWPPNSLDAEDGVGFYRNFDGFIVTCGLDHIGGAKRSDAGHFIHKHRKSVFNPLHGRISGQRATLSGYGIDWSASVPVIWAEGVVRQSSVFGENLLLRRRIEIDVFGNAIRLNDVVENQGFRPTPHAILYHVNFGYPFLDESTQLAGDLSRDLVSAFNGEDKRPRADFVDYFQETPVVCDLPEASVELRNSALLGGVRARLSFSREALPSFGIWRAYQSGVYALALEPTRRFEPEGKSENGSLTLGAGDTAGYWITIDLGSMP
ncbi:aldose 1-epimerase family protein [Neorhizobium galegae]|uniref:aldose 1-epimerase family protein n=1 Tax=Neorhizobium galegae TaxID=399 RepID=UPI00210186F8|nr:aldose 1-epimerase family protein [Neorhizobium galegae]MCQ1569135.1 aldose 1-epimerase family protein [Neorhizobium galegae]